MKVKEIIKKYKDIVPTKTKGVRLYSKKKEDLIRMVQEAEGNTPCFKTDVANGCTQTHCLWYKDCQRGIKK